MIFHYRDCVLWVSRASTLDLQVLWESVLSCKSQLDDSLWFPPQCGCVC